MNWKILTCAITLSGVATAAQALEAPATPAATAGGMRQNPQLMMPPALRMPETDPATVNLVWQAVATQFPEIVNGPERNGIFVIAIALRPDGTVVRSGMHYAEARSDVNAQQQALRDLLPADGRSVVSGGLSMQTKGATILGDRVLKGQVFLNASMVPSNWDEKRDSGIVRRAVLSQYTDLFLPRSADHMNQLIVVMNENGEVARSKVESLSVEHTGTMTRMSGGCRLSMVPGGFAQTGGSAEQAAANFAPLDMELNQMGMVGMLSLRLPMNPLVSGPRPTVGADGIERGAMPSSDPSVLQVCYAWPRRPGEPVGGTPQVLDSMPRQAGLPPQMQQVNRLVEQYFPAGGPSDGNWMLLTFNGDVVRTGHVELAKDEHLTSTYVERLLPGIKVGGSMATSYMATPKRREDPLGAPISVNVFFLTQDSPLPPAENVLLPAK